MSKDLSTTATHICHNCQTYWWTIGGLDPSFCMACGVSGQLEYIANPRIGVELPVPVFRHEPEGAALVVKLIKKGAYQELRNLGYDHDTVNRWFEKVGHPTVLPSIEEVQLVDLGEVHPQACECPRCNGVIA